MRDYLYSEFIEEKKVYIGDIPAILLTPRGQVVKLPTIIFYHGWSSNKESQRLRGLIFATVGFQVLIPDAEFHGERNPIEYTKENLKYLWDAIFNSLDEAKLLLDEIISKFNGDPDRISVIGHSMGGYTAAGVFTYNPSIRSLVVLNGSCAWKHSADFNIKELNIHLGDNYRDLEEKIVRLDPYNNLDLLKDRPILMLHGTDDRLSPIETQKHFLRKIRPLYKDKGMVDLIGYTYLNHFVTSNMLEDSIKWFKKY